MENPVLASLPFHVPLQQRMIYAGVGSRETPPEMLATMTKVAKRLDELGYILYSGGAAGADMAFERGAAKKRIFFALQATNDERAQELVNEVHPFPSALRQYPRDLMARNAYQVFGKEMDTPVDFVLCWTPDGVEHHEQRKHSTGGTGQAISLASLKGIPVVNMANPDWKNKLKLLVMPDIPHE